MNPLPGALVHPFEKSAKGEQFIEYFASRPVFHKCMLQDQGLSDPDMVRSGSGEDDLGAIVLRHALSSLGFDWACVPACRDDMDIR
ncbi:hypothetical protein [Komagataeibacter rhaeticus]|uniref:hypothetical protein n=1 Tax=Komagataeibacter rhaeticus TaxID=215221 RepID=UPI0039EADCDD